MPTTKNAPRTPPTVTHQTQVEGLDRFRAAHQGQWVMVSPAGFAWAGPDPMSLATAAWPAAAAAIGLPRVTTLAADGSDC